MKEGQDKTSEAKRIKGGNTRNVKKLDKWGKDKKSEAKLIKKRQRRGKVKQSACRGERQGSEAKCIKLGQDKKSEAM